MSLMFSSLRVVDHLTGVDIAKAQSVDQSSKLFIDENDVWNLILKKELPDFVVSEEILRDSEQRPLLVRCYGILRRAIRTLIVKVTTPRELRRLEACLKDAARTTASHTARGGNAAYMLVGRFDLASYGISSCFLFGSEQYPAFMGLRAGCLFLKISFKHGAMSLGGRYHEAGAAHVDTARTLSFRANVASVEPAAGFSFQEAHLILDERFRRLEHGFCNLVRDHEAQDRSLISWLCVISLRDGSPQPITSQSANSLSMETLTDECAHLLPPHV
eukprot:TRINITY_DN67533_c0_g1_i1.p1 TRINITY_DN67533_c0_g1~~TRINITY_DN67533_c0_g1_i1.p1  ORF type:complete len:274 (+),score=32.13 TRINITY_DN67533_c0_g1_i1:24-845(+)